MGGKGVGEFRLLNRFSLFAAAGVAPFNAIICDFFFVDIRSVRKLTSPHNNLVACRNNKPQKWVHRVPFGPFGVDGPQGRGSRQIDFVSYCPTYVADFLAPSPSTSTLEDICMVVNEK